jgi:peptide/nickel transport system ATP-binding protein
VTEPAAPLLSVSNLSVAFRTEAGLVNAVRSVSYDVHPGEVLGIVGESGSGKSVSSLAIMNLLPGHARVTGSARLGGRELIGRPDAELSHVRGRQIAMVFQDPLSALTPVYTVGDQLAEAVLVHEDVSRAAGHARAVDLLGLVGIPNPQQRANAFPHEFSGGMRQRVMIAMAIANRPSLIIADEPTTALDVTIQAQILDVLQTARRMTGAAIVLITHDLGVIAGVADRVAVMYAGTIVETGTVDDVFYRPRMPYTLGLLGSVPRADLGERQQLTPIEGAPPSLIALPPGCPFTPRCPMRQEICRHEEPALLPIGPIDRVRSRVAAVRAEADHGAPPSARDRRSACHFRNDIERDELKPADVFPAPSIPATALPRERRDQRDPVIEVHDLVKSYPLMKGAVLRRKVGEVRAVDGITFDIRAGETLGLVGESGCGKTTTIMEILSLERPMAGAIRVLGRDTAVMTPADRIAIRRDLQVVFQDPMASLDPRLPVGDIIAEPLATHGVPPSERSQRIRELLQLVGLQLEQINRYPAAFSGGQRQRIGIARALALEPKVLVLDEPVSALDVSVRAGVINLLERLRAELGLSYLFVAHDLAVVRHIADRVAVMYLGWIVEIGDVDELFDAPAHPYTQALLSAIPLPDPRKERQRTRIVLQGDMPSPANPPSGCRFRTRCQKFANELTDAERGRCVDEVPPLAARTGSADHLDRCHWAASATVL